MELAKRIQIELMIVDLYRGPIDGIVGPKTLEAIMKYQRLKGLPVTGNIDETLLRAMNLR
jgi:peptidoglycan hydrolase-like protein with peptidoglycan-binding domain